MKLTRDVVAPEVWLPTNGHLVDQTFYVARAPMRVVGIRGSHLVRGSDGSPVNVQVTKDTGKQLPGGGVNLLAFPGFDLKAPTGDHDGVLTATAADLELATGDRLGLDFGGTLTSVSGVRITVELEILA